MSSEDISDTFHSTPDQLRPSKLLSFSPGKSLLCGKLCCDYSLPKSYTHECNKATILFSHTYLIPRKFSFSFPEHSASGYSKQHYDPPEPYRFQYHILIHVFLKRHIIVWVQRTRQVSFSSLAVGLAF